MTAEIAILNNSAIALATDSAVTIGSSKVYKSANKLFTLSKFQPVGIMLYESADLIGIPWEIIIKEYRWHLGAKSFRTLQEYSDDFWDFITTHPQVVPERNKRRYAQMQTAHFLQTLSDNLDQRVNHYIAQNGAINTAATLALLYEILDENDRFIDDLDFLQGASHDSAESILGKWRVKFEVALGKYPKKLLGGLPKERKEQIYRQISLLFVKRRFTAGTTGVVIAGYGTSEIFPKIASFLVEGVIDNHVKMTVIAGKSNVQDNEFNSAIIPFAQDEMVWTFLGGIDPAMQDFINTHLNVFVENLLDLFQKNVLDSKKEDSTKVRAVLTSGATELLEKTMAKISNFQQMNYTQPVLDMVNVLPKNELADMAGTLVNLTVFKHKISRSMETVAAPVDVAVITRGDGFIWVKRKHYFQPELNQHFFSNYFRRTNYEERE